jgi:hypothetical protein
MKQKLKTVLMAVQFLNFHAELINPARSLRDKWQNYSLPSGHYIFSQEHSISDPRWVMRFGLQRDLLDTSPRETESGRFEDSRAGCRCAHSTTISIVITKNFINFRVFFRNRNLWLIGVGRVGLSAALTKKPLFPRRHECTP